MKFDPSRKLTKSDEITLNSYAIMLEGLAAYFGNSFEFVLNRFDDLDHSVIMIINGYHSNRTVGAPVTDLTLERLINTDNEMEHYYMTHTTTSQFGEPIRSVTIPIVGEGNWIIGMVCINFYASSSISTFMSGFLQGNEQLREGANSGHVSENYAANSEGIISKALEEAKAAVYDDRAVTASNRNKAIIRALYERGIFSLKDSVALVSRSLGLSKNTVYLYIRKSREGGDGQ